MRWWKVFLIVALLSVLNASLLWAACDGTEPEGLTQKRSLILQTLDREEIKKHFDTKGEKLWESVRGQFIDPALAASFQNQVQDMEKRCTNQTLTHLADIDEQYYTENEVKTLSRVTKLLRERDTRSLSAEEKQFLDNFYNSPLRSKEERLVSPKRAALGDVDAMMEEEFQQKVNAAFPESIPPPPATMPSAND